MAKNKGRSEDSDDFLDDEDEEDSERKQEILKIYVGLMTAGNFFPGRVDLKEKGVSRDQLRHHFGNLSGIRLAAKEKHPEVFKGSIDLNEYLSPANLAAMNKRIKKHKRFVVTTAVVGQKIHDNFLKSIDVFCDKNDAKLLILPAHDPAHNLDNEIEWFFDPKLVEDGHDFVFEETPLNSNYFISGIRVTAKQINPITGLNEISQTKGSFVSASPKQFLEYDSVSANKLPHARMTTGACTLPNYSSSRGNSQRTAYLAEHQHTIGALVIEIQDNNIYFFTQIQSDEKGNFCHYGYEYSPTKQRKLVGNEAPVFVMGDYHAGEHDETAVSAWINVINTLGIQELVFHDMFNAVSVNHHEEKDMMLRAERARKGLHILENELNITAREFDRMLSLKSVKKGVVVKSNHDDMIDRWLRPMKFAKDPVNLEFGTILAADIITASKKGIKKDFFKTGLEHAGEPKHMSKIVWLASDEDYVVGGVHLGAHGDKSSNGSKGSIKGLARSYPKCVIGHSHTPGIFKGAFQVGTTSLLRLGYNKGPSSWVHCSCLVYRNGQRQLINSINGAWKLAG